MFVEKVKLTDAGGRACKLSRFVAGFWRQNSWGMSDLALHAHLEALLELGISTMDHAFVYRSETQFGRVLKQTPSLRSEIQIVTKFGIRPCGFDALGAGSTPHYDSSASYLVRSVDNSLSNLNVDYIDVLLVHRPDYLMRADELAAGLKALIDAGKILHVGVSNFNTSQFELLQSACDFRLVTHQIECSPLHMDALDNGVLDCCQQHHIRPMFWSCLGGGRIFSESDTTSIRVRETITRIADELGASSIEQVVFAWLLSLPCDGLPVLGSQRIVRLKSAISSLQLNSGAGLSREHWYAIWSASKGFAVP